MNKPIGLIIAGGQSSRMGGSDKALIMLNGKPLIMWIIERLAPQVGQILINTNRNNSVYQSFGFPVLQDSVSGFQGPLTGVLSALEHIQQSTTSVVANGLEILVTPVDTPQLPLDLYARLSRPKESIVETPLPITVAHDGQRQQSLFMLIPIPDNDHLEKYIRSLRHSLEQGRHSVQMWLEQQHCINVDFSDEADCFLNINTLNELNSYLQHTHAD